MYHRSTRQRAISQVQPVIAELLRTCVHPPILYLRIERVIRKTVELESDSENERRPGHAIKLLLTDNELVIHGLLHRKLSALPEIEDLRSSDILEIHESVLKKARRVNGRGHLVFLGIENCYVIKTEEVQHGESSVSAVTEAYSIKRKRSDSQIRTMDGQIEEAGGGFLQENTKEPIMKRQRLKDITEYEHGQPEEINLQNTKEISLYAENEESDNVLVNQSTQRKPNESSQNITPLTRKLVQRDSQSDDESAFETQTVDITTAKKRREVLRELNQNAISSPSWSLKKDSIPTSPRLHSSTQHEAMVSENSTQHEMVMKKAQHSEPTRLNETTAIEGEDLSQITKPSQLANDEGISAVSKAAISVSQISNQPQVLDKPRPTTPMGLDAGAYLWGILHSLASLYSPSLPSKSYVFSTLIIPTYVASHLISRPHSPFPPKRHIKVIDQSLANKLALSKRDVLGKGITVSVYRDAADFKPIVGKAALMRGVVMQRLNDNSRGASGKGRGEVILNVYPSNSRIHKQSQSQFGSPQYSHGQSQTYSANLDKRQDQPARAQYHSAINSHTLTNNISTKASRGEAQVRFDIPGTASMHMDLSTDSIDETHWFVDNHQFLKNQGHDVDPLQNWWDQMMGSKSS